MRKKDELATNAHSCMSSAHPEEMVFVLLSRDIAAPVAIRAWVAERLRVGKNVDTDPQIVEALACARTMEIEGAKWKPKPAEPAAPRPYVIAFGRLGDVTYLVDLESEETADKARAMRFVSVAEAEKTLRAYEWIAAKGGAVALCAQVQCPRAVFVDDGWPPGQCKLESGHAGLCELWMEARSPVLQNGAL